MLAQSTASISRSVSAFSLPTTATKRHLIKVGQPRRARVIAADDGYLATQFAVVMAIEQVGQAVIVVGDQDCDSGPMIGEGEPILHQEAVGHMVEMRFELS